MRIGVEDVCVEKQGEEGEGARVRLGVFFVVFLSDFFRVARSAPCAADEEKKARGGVASGRQQQNPYGDFPVPYPDDPFDPCPINPAHIPGSIVQGKKK